jgi:hypothetical protein
MAYVRKKFLLPAVIALVLCAGIVFGQARPRFEQTYEQEIGGPMGRTFEVYHDKDTGQEIVCARVSYNSSGYSCFLSGRSWK